MYLRRRIDFKKLTILIMLTFQSILLSLLDNLLTLSVAFTGVKIGLANIVTILTLIFFSYNETIVIVFIKSVVVFLFSGGPVIFINNLIGGLLAATIMWLILKSMRRFFSLIGIGIIGTIANNLGQVLITAYIISGISITDQLNILLTASIFFGAIIGFCSSFFIRAFKHLNLIENI